MLFPLLCCVHDTKNPHRQSLDGDLCNLIKPYGGRTRARTLDPLIKSQLLYQLSYAPTGLPSRVRGLLAVTPLGGKGFFELFYTP